MSRVQILDLEPMAIMRRTLFRDMLRGLLLFVIVPLRLIARRPPADEKWIAELELELGMRKPKDFVGKFGDPRLITLADGGRGWRHRQAIRATFTYERIDRYSRRLQPKPKPAPSREPLILGHDWEHVTINEQRDRSGIGSLRDQRAACWAQAKTLLEDCADRVMTRGEMAAWDSLNERLDQLDVKISQEMRRSNAAALAQLDAAAERKAELASFSHRIAEGMRKAELGEWTEVRYVDGESVILPATRETEAELRKRTADYERGQDEARRWLDGLG